MSLHINSIKEALNSSSIKDIEAEIRHYEYKISQLKAERDKAYSGVLGSLITYDPDKVQDALNNSTIKDIEAMIRHYEFKIGQLKTEWDKTYSRAINRARAKALEDRGGSC